MRFCGKQFVGATSWEGVVVFARHALCGRWKRSTPAVRSRRRLGKLQTSSLRFKFPPTLYNCDVALEFFVSRVVTHWIPLFFSKFEAEYRLCVNRGRSCLEVCTADVIRKFQILVWCLNKVWSSSVIEFHPHYVVSVTCLTLYCKFGQCSGSDEVGA